MTTKRHNFFSSLSFLLCFALLSGSHVSAAVMPGHDTGRLKAAVSSGTDPGALFSTAIPEDDSADAAAAKKGLQKRNGKYVYVKDNGKLLRNRSKKIGKYVYVFGADGYLVRKYKYVKPGWKTINGKTYYILNDGSTRKVTGWIKGPKYTYYVGPDYSRVTGFRTIGGKIYFFRSNGTRFDTQGFRTIGGKTYYFRSDSTAATGLQTIGGKLYYFTAQGVLVKSQTSYTVNGRYFVIDANGVATEVTALQAQCSTLTWKYINAHSSAAQTKLERFRACFNYIEAYMIFQSWSSDLYDFNAPGWQYIFANRMFNNGLIGDCYGFACVVASVAKEFGYVPYVHLAREDHAFVTIDGRYYDNSGALFGTTTQGGRSYTIWKTIKF